MCDRFDVFVLFLNSPTPTGRKTPSYSLTLPHGQPYTVFGGELSGDLYQKKKKIYIKNASFCTARCALDLANDHAP